MKMIFVLMTLGLAFTANAQLPPPGWGDEPGYPGNPNPPGYHDVYGPGRTVRWEDKGRYRTEKFFEGEVRLDVRGQYVNEVFVGVWDNHVDVTEAVAYLSNGRAIRLNNMIGTAQAGRQYRILLDYRNSLRVERLVYRIKSGNLIGPRGTIGFQLGLAY
jgi:hypothetical protein